MFVVHFSLTEKHIFISPRRHGVSGREEKEQGGKGKGEKGIAFEAFDWFERESAAATPGPCRVIAGAKNERKRTIHNVGVATIFGVAAAN